MGSTLAKDGETMNGWPRCGYTALSCIRMSYVRKLSKDNRTMHIICSGELLKNALILYVF